MIKFPHLQVLFDQNGCLKKYESPLDILQEFFDLRLKFYGKRKSYLLGMLEAEAALLSNKVRNFFFFPSSGPTILGFWQLHFDGFVKD